MSVSAPTEARLFCMSFDSMRRSSVARRTVPMSVRPLACGKRGEGLWEEGGEGYGCRGCRLHVVDDGESASLCCLIW